MSRLLALAAATLVLGCSTPSCKFGPPPPAPVNGDACEAAEARIVALNGCGLPTPFTAAACHRAANDGRDWHPRCIAAVADCSQLDDAYRGKRCP